ncbi:MAG TPA: GDSL-type esterase/lipase family protein [Gemmataceae bacterium]|nr:GDSL-type esterase/lipase family protein [Gemmataceae bacterium]
MSFTVCRRLLAAGLTGLLLLLSSTGLRADDQNSKNTAVVPAPRPEFKWWTQRHDQFVRRAHQGHVDVLFLGDSITQGWEGGGRKPWNKYMEPLHAANFGIGGDQTQHVLWRITAGHELDGIHPKVTVLMIGTNNLGSNNDTQIEEGIEKIVKTLHQERPHMQILLLGVFPRAHEASSPVRKRIKDINEHISQMDGKDNVHYLDIGDKFLEPNGTLSPKIMPDFLHPNQKGYEIETKAILPEIKKLLKE